MDFRKNGFWPGDAVVISYNDRYGHLQELRGTIIQAAEKKGDPWTLHVIENNRLAIVQKVFAGEYTATTFRGLTGEAGLALVSYDGVPRELLPTDDASLRTIIEEKAQWGCNELNDRGVLIVDAISKLNDAAYLTGLASLGSNVGNEMRQPWYRLAALLRMAELGMPIDEVAFARHDKRCRQNEETRFIAEHAADLDQLALFLGKEVFYSTSSDRWEHPPGGSEVVAVLARRLGDEGIAAVIKNVRFTQGLRAFLSRSIQSPETVDELISAAKAASGKEWRDGLIIAELSDRKELLRRRQSP